MSKQSGLPAAAGVVLLSLIAAACSPQNPPSGGSNQTENLPPTVNAGNDRPAAAGSTVTLTGTATDADGTIASVSWQQTGGTPAVTLSSTDTNSTRFTAPSTPATLSFTFSATDDDGASASATVTVTAEVENLPPAVSAGADQTVGAGAAVTLTATAADSDGSVTSMQWTQDGGEAVALDAPGQLVTAFTAPANAGALTFTFTATDDDGASASDTVIVSVVLPETRSGTLRALTYNVAGLPEAVSGEEPSTNAPLISPLLNDYDLVLLQEDWTDPLQQMQEQGLLPAGDFPALFGYHHLTVSEARHPFQSEPAPPPLGTDLRRGLDGVLGPMLLSDGLNRLSQSAFGELERVMWRACNGYQLVTPLQALLEALGLDEYLEPAGVTGDEGMVDDGSADCGAQKGFSVASHELAPGVTVDVYNLHADASGHDKDLEARADNFAQLADFIVSFSEGRAVILGGDTNLRFDSTRREHQRESDGGAWASLLTATGLTDVCAVLDCGNPDALVAEKFKIHDRFAFRSGGGIQIRPISHRFERERFTRDDGERLSDHDPVAVVFQWSTAPSLPAP